MNNEKFSESRARVRYKETDQMGIAHHSNYFVWFEVGRTDLCREAALSYREIEERGFLLVVTEVGCKYRTPFRYDDEVVIRTRVGRVSRRALRFEYELLDDSGSRHADGFSHHVWVDRVTRRPVSVPHDLWKPFEAYRVSKA
jgi:acyl-CoA thioester hydrolase, YbgC/YbaW family